MIFEKYVINPKTVLITAEFDQKGHLYSRVIEGEKTFIVTMHPKTLIDNSLRYYCSSIKGALEGSRSILGNVSMQPIMINTQLDICWFPCFSPERNDCVWFSLTHVINSEKISLKQTTVNLNFGHNIILDMKRERFENKRQRASQLRYISLQRTKQPAIFYLEPKKGIQLIKEQGNPNYNITFYKME